MTSSAVQEKPISRELIRLGAPLAAIEILNLAISAADTIMVGNFCGETAIAALGYSSFIGFATYILGYGLTIAIVILNTRKWATRDYAGVAEVLGQAVLLSVAIGSAVALTTYLAAPGLLGFLGAKGEALELGVDYARIITAAAPINFLGITWIAAVRATENSRLPLIASIFANLVNVSLNYCLIGGKLGFPALGVQGAAIGSVVSYFVTFSCLLALCPPELKWSRTRLKPNLRLIAEMRRIATSPVLNASMFLCMTIGMIAFVGRFGDAAVGAHHLGHRVLAAFYCVTIGIGGAAEVLIGAALARNHQTRAISIAFRSILLSFALTLPLVLAMLLAPSVIAGFFGVSEGSLGDYTVQCFRIFAFLLLCQSIFIPVQDALIVANHSSTVLRINVVFIALFQAAVIVFAVFALDLGALGVWIGSLVAYSFRTIYGTRKFWMMRRSLY